MAKPNLFKDFEILPFLLSDENNFRSDLHKYINENSEHIVYLPANVFQFART